MQVSRAPTTLLISSIIRAAFNDGLFCSGCQEKKTGRAFGNLMKNNHSFRAFGLEKCTAVDGLKHTHTTPINIRRIIDGRKIGNKRVKDFVYRLDWLTRV